MRLPLLPAGLRAPGPLAALAAAALFGASTPFAKALLATVDPWLLAGLLYLGSGVGLSLSRCFMQAPPVRLGRGEWAWLAGAIAAGGIAAPVQLMWGLASMPASGAALLLNAESVFTALLAWFVFGEHPDRRIAIGMLLIVAGAAVLSWPAEIRFGDILPALAVLGACAGWALDNNLTRKLALADAGWLAAVKGLTAGSVNLLLALYAGAHWPAWPQLLLAGSVGWLAYGVSLVLFVVALRHLGTARTGAYFSIAPFVGALLAVLLLDEPVSARLLFAGALMGIGVWLHLSERHEHAHAHEAIEHDHWHEHDAHHPHEHAEALAGRGHHHLHRHAPLTHTHPHYPDAHHRHGHTPGAR